MDEADILNLVKSDSRMMRILEVAESINFPDWLIGAGFVRNKVWDHLHGYKENTPPSDIDLVYFDKENRFSEKEIEERLKTQIPELDWEVVNQATAHDWNEEEPYTSTADAISKWPETATGIGVTLKNRQLKLVAPVGIEDLVKVIARPTPAFKASESKRARVQERIKQKRWKEKWPKLQILKD